MFRDEQNKLGYCHRSGMAEFAKPINMVSGVQQDLQETYFSIRYLFQKTVNQNLRAKLPSELYLKCDPDE